MYRKRGISLNHIAEILSSSETFAKKAAFRMYENKTRDVLAIVKERKDIR